MYLDVLSCRQVQIARCIFIRYVGDPQQLFRCNLSKRQLDANHLNTLLTLTINAARKAQASEFLFVNPSFPEETYLFFQIDDVSFYYRVLQLRPETLHSDK